MKILNRRQLWMVSAETFSSIATHTDGSPVSTGVMETPAVNLRGGAELIRECAAFAGMTIGPISARRLE